MSERQCLTCDSKIPAEPSYAKYCSQCYTTRKDLWQQQPKRRCSQCAQDSILLSDPAWKTVCSACYAQQPDCESCPRKLKPGTASYITKCHICWLKLRANTHDACPTCTGTRVGQLRKLKTDPQCPLCLTTPVEILADFEPSGGIEALTNDSFAGHSIAI